MQRLAPRWSLLFAAAAAALAASPAAAQAIRATARDAATGAPVAEALVRALGQDGAQVAAGFSDEAGVVVLRLPRPGTYRVEAQRSGYHATTMQVEVGGREVQTELRLARRPIALDTVVVFGQQRGERGRHAFTRRQSLGVGVFLDSTYLDQARERAPYLNDLLRGVPGLQLVRNSRGIPRPTSVRGWRCMVLLVDGEPVQFVFADGYRRELHQMVAPSDVKGVEVYREFSEVPQEFRRHAHNGMYGCGVYLYWTRARW